MYRICMIALALFPVVAAAQIYTPYQQNTNNVPQQQSYLPDNTIADSYRQQAYRPNPYNGVGAQGYDGTRYIPAGSDPNPPPYVAR